MNRRVLFAVALVMAFVVSNAGAQTVERLSFDEVLHLALERSTSLKSSASQLELEAASVRAEKADFLPNLSMSASPSVNFGFSFDQSTLQLVNERTWRANYSVGSTLNIFRGGADLATLKQARLSYQAADYSHDRTTEDVISEAILNYLQVIQDKEQVKIQQENVEAQRQLLSRIEEFTRVGTRPVSDLYQQQAQLAQDELTLLNAEHAVQISKARLIGQLKLNPVGDYEFDAPPTDEVALEPTTYDLQELIQIAFENRTDLAAGRRRIDAARQGVKASRALYWPQIDLSGGYGSSYSSADQLDRSFSTQFDEKRSGDVRIGLSIPIFNRFDTKYRVEQAQVQRKTAEWNYDDLEQRVALEVRQAVLDYQTAVKSLEVTERQLRAAQQALDAEQERYNVGASTLVELSQARAQYVSAASNRSSAIYSYLARTRLIDYYVGRIKPDETIF
ncbi:MAG: TolC family protein [Rhodothermales bacterium]